MKNIGIVTTWFERGAAYVSRQFKEVLEQEFNVFIYVRGGESFGINDPKWNQGNIYWGKRNPLLISSKIYKRDFENWIKQNSIDIVFFNEQQVWDPIIWCAELNVLTGAYIDYYTKESVELFNSYDFLICNTKRHYSVFKDHPQCFYIPWGTLVEVFKPIEKIPENNQRIVFFHSAGMNPFRKGTDILLKALKKVSKDDYKIIIHTQVDLMKFFPELEDLINGFKQKGLLEIIEKTVTAPGLYYMGDIYVYPTRLEGIGLTIAEALSCGLPVITTDAPPMSEFVIHGETGYLVNVGNEEFRDDKYFWPQTICNEKSLIEAIEFFLNNKDVISNMSVNSRRYAETMLNWNNNRNEIIKAFRKVVLIENSKKNEAIKNCKKYERMRPIGYYLNTFRPYLICKQRIKRIISQ